MEAIVGEGDAEAVAELTALGLSFAPGAKFRETVQPRQNAVRRGLAGMSEEQLLEGLRKTPELKRRLVMRVAADLLESEAFLEAYPHLETEEQIKTALTRLLHKNKVSTIDGRRMAAELAESYEGMYSHSDRSEGPASGHESHSSQPVT